MTNCFAANFNWLASDEMERKLLLILTKSMLHVLFFKKLVYKKLRSDLPLNPRNQSSNFNFHKKLEKIFTCLLEVNHRFLLLSTQNIYFYTLIMNKKIKLHHRSFVNERKKLSLVLYNIPGCHWNKKPLRNFTGKLRANS